MDNQHKKITGYRELTQQEINAMNVVKDLGEEINEIVSEMESVDTFDQRWVAIAKEDLQKGIMFAVRAIAQPNSF